MDLRIPESCEGRVEVPAKVSRCRRELTLLPSPRLDV